jgi:chemotaxis protein methyltransferase CheR
MFKNSEISKLNLNEVIMDSMPGNVYILDEEGKIVACNLNATKVYGYNGEEFLNRSVLDFIDEVDHEKVINTMASSKVDEIIQVENTALTKDGKKIPYLGSATTVFINDKKYFIGLGVDISELNSARKIIQDQMCEISKLNELLNAENIYLKDQLELRGDGHNIIGVSEHLKYIMYKINQVGPTKASVLIQGETGTGKELVAKAIHEKSERKNKQFIKVNCASIPENLIESELFGHEKGAFTGAIEKCIGRFELADGGTIFLDEIGELPMKLQPKLLHVLQHGEFERLGSSKTIKTDVRVIAATNKVIDDEIKKGNFRNDLFYRLNVFPITLIPLRERKDDIVPLVEHYVKYYSKKMNKKINVISKAALKRLMEYSWPGNVRELENIIERAIITSHNYILNLESLPKSQGNEQVQLTLEENEKSHIIKTLEQTGWKINGPGGAAEVLKINPQTLRSRIKKLGISRNLKVN